MILGSARQVKELRLIEGFLKSTFLWIPDARPNNIPIEIEVSGQQLENLVRSEEFTTRLAKAARITMTEHHESGFRLYRYVVENDDCWTPVFEGDAAEMPRLLYIGWEIQHARHYATMHCAYPLLCFHFHASLHGAMLLSEGDIETVDGPRGDLRPVACVGTVDEKGKGRILLLQKTFPGLLQDESNSLREQIYNTGRENAWLWKYEPVEYAKSIEVPGFFQAGVLDFELPPRRMPAVIANPETMNSFAYKYSSAGWENPDRDMFSP